ncbi:Golgi to ER traffic protein 4 homolog isoform X2 [Megachile rotundata]|uniref:Golgi to ER traffic protein 4 homolog isoform X2 n=1 Tax=Megachile rotundata TaxID=143995 RepID=UPI000614B4A0|nr:PREDICTED: Golgi to ER traffic protein 4 homolog isoform X2 [Megachile rotundata]XP_012152088.1 PREDICTED: Golgi to ER traffic protein 4 homolog isoform X2 [Megachile rotundata]
MASRYNHGVQRVLTKLEASINSENYYEAHQMYRTLYFRYLGQKKYSELLELLYNGSTLLLQHEQHASGADLGILFINVLTQSGTEPSQVYFEKITNLLCIMSSSSPERDIFIQSALRWSIRGNEYKTGHPDLHQKIAQVFWKEKNYIMARQHFIHSKDGSGYAAMLVELHEQRGYMNEIDLFIAQAVLQYLCLQNKTAAQEVFNSYTSQHPKINRGPPYLLPLLNFLFFLLKIIDSGKLTAFKVLCEQYEISLNRDPCYRQYLDKIEQSQMMNTELQLHKNLID